MKTLKLLSTGLLIAILYFACSPSAALLSSSATLTEKLSAVAANWDNMTDYDPHGNCFTYVPEVGVRARYQRSKPEMGLFIVESLVGKKAFLKGPHTQGVDCSDEYAFGYYNPVFLTELQSIVNLTFSNPQFVNRFQSLYDRALRTYLRNFYLSYTVGTSSQAIQNRYLAILNDTNAGEDAGDYLQEAFRNHADAMERKGYDWYESNTCAAFWARRSIDGTADEFYALLLSALKIFDPGFVKPS